ncbi:DUF362 domain-containing protein, partial [Chloroflexota bacterium]
KSVLSGVKKLWTESTLREMIPAGGSVAIKIHMGELGNITYIRPTFVRQAVELVKEAGGKPFVTDTTALYPGHRNTESKYLSTAAFNGFVQDSLGAPVVIADGDGYDGISAPVINVVDGCDLRNVDIAARIHEASFLLVLSHVKGHILAGFGGAVKNLAMGCVTKKGKRDQHRVNNPSFDDSRCDGCGSCLKVCPAEAITIVEEKAKFDMEKCLHCSSCLFACPSGALFWEKGCKEQLQIYMAHAASAVWNRFQGRIGFINFVQDITPDCDCMAPAGKAVVPDIGILASMDPVAIDKASLDLIDRSPVILSPAPSTPPDILGKMHQVDSLVQLRTAQTLGLGSMDYKLITL